MFRVAPPSRVLEMMWVAFDVAFARKFYG